MAVDTYTGSLLDLIADSDDHAHHRAEIERVILAVALEHDGRIDPNVVRDRIPAWVQPQRPPAQILGPLRRPSDGRGRRHRQPA